MQMLMFENVEHLIARLRADQLAFINFFQQEGHVSGTGHVVFGHAVGGKIKTFRGNERVMQSQLNKCFLKVIESELANQKLGCRVVGIADHVFQKFAVGVNGAEARQLQHAGSALFIAALKRDGSAERQLSVFNRLERGAENRKFNEARAGKHKIAVDRSRLSAVKILDDVPDGAAEMSGPLADRVGQRLPIIRIDRDPLDLDRQSGPAALSAGCRRSKAIQKPTR